MDLTKVRNFFNLVPGSAIALRVMQFLIAPAPLYIHTVRAFKLRACSDFVNIFLHYLHTGFRGCTILSTISIISLIAGKGDIFIELEKHRCVTSHLSTGNKERRRDRAAGHFPIAFG